MGRTLEMEGEKFGKLTVLKRLKNCKHGKSRWLCICECGNKTTPNGSDLKKGKVKSCGCTQRKHGLSKSRLYVIWYHMKRRCYNSNSTSYPWYGKRGIKVCDEWLDDFIAFREWALKNGYRDNLEIDRINVNENYSPQNCKWTDRVNQVRNQRINKKNTSGVRGVKKRPNGKWEVGISAKGKRYYLGVYSTIEEAKKVRKKAELKYW